VFAELMVSVRLSALFSKSRDQKAFSESMKGLLRTLLPAVVLALASLSAPAETFEVSDIQVEGLQRVSAGNVFSALPIEVGDRINDATVADAIRNLFQTGLFANIRLAREDSVLIVSVEERPSIARIEVEGTRTSRQNSSWRACVRPGWRKARSSSVPLWSALSSRSCVPMSLRAAITPM